MRSIFDVRIKYEDEKIIDEKADIKKLDKLFKDLKHKFK